MTHVEHLLSLIQDGESLRDHMRREMEVMAELIQRQNETCIRQGAMINEAEAKISELERITKAETKRTKGSATQIHALQARINKMKAQEEIENIDKQRMKDYIKSLNNGQWPEELK